MGDNCTFSNSHNFRLEWGQPVRPTKIFCIQIQNTLQFCVVQLHHNTKFYAIAPKSLQMYTKTDYKIKDKKCTEGFLLLGGVREHERHECFMTRGFQQMMEMALSCLLGSHQLRTRSKEAFLSEMTCHKKTDMDRL